MATLLLSTTITAQELTVTEFKQKPFDPAATQYAVKDLNGHNCALVIVGMAADSVTFEGDIVKQIRRPNGEYWLYFADVDAQYVVISAKGFAPREVYWNKIEGSNISSLTSGTTYSLIVEVPMVGLTFNEVLANARHYYANRQNPANARYNYFDAAKIAYEKAIEHNDCSYDLRDTLKTEYNDVLFMRKLTHHHESATDSILKYVGKYGEQNHEVFRWLVADRKILQTLLEKHPELTALEAEVSRLNTRIQQHPSSKTTTTQTELRQRQQVNGKVVIENPYLNIPLNTISIFASPYRTVKKEDRRYLQLLGKADANGYFHVVMPEEMHYIITSAEITRKAEAHYLGNNTSITITIY